MTEILSVDEFMEKIARMQTQARAGKYDSLEGIEASGLRIALLAAYRALHESKAPAAGPTIKAWFTRDEEDNALHKYPYMLWVESVISSLRLEGVSPDRCWNARTSNPVPFDLDKSAIPERLRLEPGGGPLAVELPILGVKEAAHESVDGA